MRFSEYFRISPNRKDDWFDPFLFTDTKLFVDPFLIWAEDSDHWRSAHDDLIEFFNMALSLLAKSGLKTTSAHWRAVERLFLFPEPYEFCLGYSEGTPFGSGAGPGLQSGMLEGAARAIKNGIESVEHFEELSLFEGGIGADRISDVVCNVLKAYFIGYTEDVARRHGLETGEVRIRNASWTKDPPRWISRFVSLPINPYNRAAVLLTPRYFLRDLPSVDPSEFWDWAWGADASALRADFNYDVGRRVDKEEIARLARHHPHLVKGFVRTLEEKPKDPYDLEADPDFAIRWYEEGARIAAVTPLAFLATKPQDFCKFVRSVVDSFVHYVEQQDGWTLLWHNDRNRGEKAVQALFRGTVIHYCRANDVDLTGEANAGRGAVDFKFSQGWNARALVEVKLANNSNFWHGVVEQLPQYLKSEQVECGFFLSVGFRDIDFKPERTRRVKEAAMSASKAIGGKIEPVFLDARPKTSASRR